VGDGDGDGDGVFTCTVIKSSLGFGVKLSRQQEGACGALVTELAHGAALRAAGLRVG
jgi:hypothetical protein